MVEFRHSFLSLVMVDVSHLSPSPYLISHHSLDVDFLPFLLNLSGDVLCLLPPQSQDGRLSVLSPRYQDGGLPLSVSSIS